MRTAFMDCAKRISMVAEKVTASQVCNNYNKNNRLCSNMGDRPYHERTCSYVSPIDTGVNLFTAEYKDGKWSGWQYAEDRLNKDYQGGEMCLTPDGGEMYFHSARAGGMGGLDVWVTRKVGGEWQTPENVAAVNTVGDEGWPYVTHDGNELWFTRTYLGSPAIYRSVTANGTWSEPELIISQFAGEPSVDGDGNIYFVHHFYTADSRMIEADIYTAQRKQG